MHVLAFNLGIHPKLDWKRIFMRFVQLKSKLRTKDDITQHVKKTYGTVVSLA